MTPCKLCQSQPEQHPSILRPGYVRYQCSNAECPQCTLYYPTEDETREAWEDRAGREVGRK